MSLKSISFSSYPKKGRRYGSKRDVPFVAASEEEEPSFLGLQENTRDLSNRPDHYNKTYAYIHVVHDCDLYKMEKLGLVFICYTRPVDQFVYMNIGNVLIDNNSCEWAVRPFSNIRKSFGGFSIELGGEVAAACLTFVDSCELQKKVALEVGISRELPKVGGIMPSLPKSSCVKYK